MNNEVNKAEQNLIVRLADVGRCEDGLQKIRELRFEEDDLFKSKEAEQIKAIRIFKKIMDLEWVKKLSMP